MVQEVRVSQYVNKLEIYCYSVPYLGMKCPLIYSGFVFWVPVYDNFGSNMSGLDRSRFGHGQ